jgi:hypothetical protein
LAPESGAGRFQARPRNQEKGEASMKKKILILASLALATALVATPAYAQAATPLVAKVPFNFIVMGKTLGPGEYTMIIANPDELKIKDENGRIVAMAMFKDSGRFSGEKGQVIFHCYGDRCFLAEIWPPNRQHGRELFTSKTEAALAKEESGKYFAVLAGHPQK